MNIGKTELVKQIADAHGTSQTQVRATLDAMLEAIIGNLNAGHAVRLQGFGSFTVKERPARKVRNPRTGEQVDAPASRKLSFKPAPTALN